MKEIILGMLLGTAFSIFFFVAMYLMVANAV
jgi:type III secretory pathway component EscT